MGWDRSPALPTWSPLTLQGSRSCYLLEGLKVPSSLTPLQQGLRIGALCQSKGRNLGSYLVFISTGRVGLRYFLWCLDEVGVSVLVGCRFPSLLARKQAFVELFCLCLLDFLVYCSFQLQIWDTCVKTKTQRTHRHAVIHIPRSLAGLASALHLSESPYTYCYN